MLGWAKKYSEEEGKMIVVTGSFIAKEGQLDIALGHSLAHVQRSRFEDGCLMFSVNIDAENPNRLVFLEEWRDMSALKVHFKVPECMAFASNINALAESVAPLNIYEATVLTG
jgi:quinol monooxygenase YgiN